MYWNFKSIHHFPRKLGIKNKIIIKPTIIKYFWIFYISKCIENLPTTLISTSDQRQHHPFFEKFIKLLSSGTKSHEICSVINRITNNKWRKFNLLGSEIYQIWNHTENFRDFQISPYGFLFRHSKFFGYDTVSSLQNVWRVWDFSILQNLIYCSI